MVCHGPGRGAGGHWNVSVCVRRDARELSGDSQRMARLYGTVCGVPSTQEEDVQ